MSRMTVAQYRAHLGLSLEAFAAIFEKSKSYFHAIEADNVCPPDLALKIEAHSNGLVNASDLNSMIATAREQDPKNPKAPSATNGRSEIDPATALPTDEPSAREAA